MFRPLLLVVACGCAPQLACPPGFVPLDEACVFDEASVIALVMDMDQGELVRINDEPFEQYFGGSLERNVWVSPVPLDEGPDLDAADLYRLIDPALPDQPLLWEFPVGTVLVHETVNREEGHTVQVKRDDYVDELGRDWWFAKLYDDGSYDTNACSPCSMCHSATERRTTDGLWGVRRDAL